MKKAIKKDFEVALGAVYDPDSSAHRVKRNLINVTNHITVNMKGTSSNVQSKRLLSLLGRNQPSNTFNISKFTQLQQRLVVELRLIYANGEIGYLRGVAIDLHHSN